MFGALAAAAACVAHGEPERQGRRPEAVPVKTATAVAQSVPVIAEAIGTVEPRSTVAVRAQVTGELATVAFEEGREVRKGDLLFTLDPRPSQVQLEQAKAVLARDQAQAENARVQAARYADLLARGLVPKEQADAMATTAAALDAAVRADEAAVKTAQLQFDYTVIRAPVDGRAGALMVHAGNLVRANDTTPLVIINEIAPIDVSFALPDKELAAVLRPAQAGALHVTATLPGTAGPGEDGVVTFVDNAADPTTGTVRVKAVFANADRRLWPGLFVNVSLTLRTEPNATVVPAEAIEDSQDGTYVFVVKADRTVEARPVEVARHAGGLAVIARGVAPGETVVVDGQLRLVPGSTVSVANDAAAPGSLAR